MEQRGWAPMVQVASAHLALAIVHLQRNELDLALGALADGRPLAAMDRAPGFAVALFQIRIDAARGRLEAARALLARLHRDLGAWQPPQLLERWLRVTEAEVDLAAADPSAALGRLPLDRPEDQGRLLVSERLLRARALLDLADPHGAEEVLAPLGDADLGPRASVELWVLTAVAADRLREDRRAGEAMRRALVAAEPEGVLPSLRRVGSGAAPPAPDPGEGAAPGTRRFVEELEAGGAAATGGSSSIAAQTIPLTDREMSVLQYLPSMMTYPEIAAELFVSVNTVKSHLRHLYAKLEVVNRRQAVTRARELGLLEP